MEHLARMNCLEKKPCSEVEDPVQDLYYKSEKLNRSSSLGWCVGVFMVLILTIFIDDTFSSQPFQYEVSQILLLNILYFMLSTTSLVFSLILVSNPQFCLSLTDDKEGILRENLSPVLNCIMYALLMVFTILWVVSVKPLFHSVLVSLSYSL